jgi:PPP family 3-phenylpropionic acid transporter
LSFIAGSTCVGWLIVDYGRQAILWVIVCTLLPMWLLSLLHLSPQLDDSVLSQQAPRQSLWALCKRKSVVMFLIITGAIQGGHAAYYSFSAIYWSQEGISEVTIALLWAIGVFAEVLLMRFNCRLFSHWTIKQMLGLGVVASILRWLALALTTDIYLLGFAQTFHAFTFALTHLAAIRYIGLQKNTEMIRYQSLYAAIALGLITAAFTYLCGAFFEPLRGNIFLMMSILQIPIVWLLKIWKVA